MNSITTKKFIELIQKADQGDKEAIQVFDELFFHKKSNNTKSKVNLDHLKTYD